LEFLASDLADKLAADQRHALDIVVHQAARMRRMVDRILEIDRLERRQFPLTWRCAPVEMAPLIEAVVEQQGLLASAKGLRLESDVPDGLPPAWADAELVGRVLQNLVDNAVKFTPPGGAIRIAVRTSESEGRSGCASRSAIQARASPRRSADRLFQKFVRGKHMERGSGLGLAFCKLAVEAQGGRIEVQSAPGRRHPHVHPWSRRRGCRFPTGHATADLMQTL